MKMCKHLQKLNWKNLQKSKPESKKNPKKVRTQQLKINKKRLKKEEQKYKKRKKNK